MFKFLHIKFHSFSLYDNWPCPQMSVGVVWWAAVCVAGVGVAGQRPPCYQCEIYRESHPHPQQYNVVSTVFSMYSTFVWSMVVCLVFWWWYRRGKMFIHINISYHWKSAYDNAKWHMRTNEEIERKTTSVLEYFAWWRKMWYGSGTASMKGTGGKEWHLKHHEPERC